MTSIVVRQRRRNILRDRRGTAVIELAFALPLLLLLLFGIVTYGGWLALAHAVQQSANEGARSALAGLTATERATLARDTAIATLRRTYGVDPAAVSTTVQDDGDTLVIDVSYDASGNPLLALPLVPHPPTRISRRTATKLMAL